MSPFAPRKCGSNGGASFTERKATRIELEAPLPDTRSHRGPHPEDALLFTAATAVVLRVATDDLCWLLSRGYASSGAIKLVGDRYQLAARQRVAVTRVSCSENDRAGRRTRQTGPETLAGRPLLVNGYNVLTTVEAALAGGVILAARDRTYRDVASMHGSFRRVEETRPAAGVDRPRCRRPGHFAVRLVSRSAGFQQRPIEDPDGRAGRRRPMEMDRRVGQRPRQDTRRGRRNRGHGRQHRARSLQVVVQSGARSSLATCREQECWSCDRKVVGCQLSVVGLRPAITFGEGRLIVGNGMRENRFVSLARPAS